MSNDILIGGPGDDTILGGQGDDQLFGLADNDFLDGGIGNDSLYGDGGDDVLLGGPGVDLLAGGTGNDTFEGGEGGIFLWWGSDALYGGEGRDVAIYAGNKADYWWQQAITADASGNLSVAWSATNNLSGEKDWLFDIDILRFNDGDITLIPPPNSLKRVSLDAGGAEQFSPSLQPLAWSADGTEVAFTSMANFGVPTTYSAIYAKNVVTGAVRALDAFISGPIKAISPDLTYLYYENSLGDKKVGAADGSFETPILDGTYTDPTGQIWTVLRPTGDVILSNLGQRIAYAGTLVSSATGIAADRWIIRDVATGDALFVENAASLPLALSPIGQTNNDVTRALMSADGSTAVFTKPSGINLAPSGIGLTDSISVWDVNSGSLKQLTNALNCGAIDISADGSTIAFTAFDPAYPYGPTAYVWSGGLSPEVALRDALGQPIYIDTVDLSADGSVLAFSSFDYRLPGYSSAQNIYRLEVGSSDVLLASYGAAGTGGNAASGMPLLSPDGQRLAFQSEATNLGPPEKVNLESASTKMDRGGARSTIITLQLPGALAAECEHFVRPH